MTLGRGYDMKMRTAAQVRRELKAAGVPDKTAAALSEGAGAAVDPAKFEKDHPDLALTPAQQRNLFVQEYRRQANTARATILQLELDQPEEQRIDPGTLDATAVELLMDLSYRGDLRLRWKNALRAVVTDRKALQGYVQDRRHWPDSRERYEHLCAIVGVAPETQPAPAAPTLPATRTSTGAVLVTPALPRTRTSTLSRALAGAAPSGLAPALVHDALAGPAQPLAPTVQRAMQARLGHDFGRTRVHLGALADASARAVGALAYTLGDHLVFRHGAYQPGTPAGDRLLAHELAHVVQQSRSPVDPGRPIVLGDPASAAEAEADRIAAAALAGAPHARVTTSASGQIQRELSFELEGDRPAFSPQTALTGLSRDQLAVLAWLRLHSPEIAAAEQQFGVDRRAIAAPIAWEALENVKSRALTLRASGPGKVHYKEGFLREGDPIAKEVEDRGLVLPRSKDERKQVLATAGGSIEYIAAIMAEIAREAALHGYDIWRDPPILTNVYQGSTLRAWRERLATRPRGEPLRPGNPMALWTVKNMAFLQDAVGAPAAPAAPVARDAPTLRRAEPSAPFTGPPTLRELARAWLAETPTSPADRAAWLLRLASGGLVTFDNNKARQQLEDLRDKKKVEHLDPAAAGYAVPVLAVEVGLVQRKVQRWLDAGGLGDPAIRLGSMIRPNAADTHGQGKAIDINGLRMTDTVDATIAVLKDLDVALHDAYGLGMPFQGDFFAPADELGAKQRAAETAAAKDATALSVSDALVRFRAHTFRATATRAADGPWTWPKDPEVHESGGAWKRLRSQALREAIAARRKEGLELMVFPDNDNHLHLELRPPKK